MTEAILTTIVAIVPNLAVAVWVIWRDSKTIERLLENNQKLIEQLMSLHPPAGEE